MKDDYLDKVVHNLTHRRFKGTSKESVYQQGSSFANSFFDPRNIGNYDAGEVDPDGTYATHYPVNQGSNTMGFAFGQSVDQGNDRRIFNPTLTTGANALAVSKADVKGGALGSSSSGSSSDYLYYNPYYAALLNPKNTQAMSEIAQPHYMPHVYNGFNYGKMEGRGTNAPSSGSATDYRQNNPYAFSSTFAGFSGGALGAASSGSASDYYSSDPNRTPEVQSSTRHYSEFMVEGGAIDWAKYLGYLKKAPAYIEKGVKIYETGAEALKHIRELREMVKPKSAKYEKVDYDEQDEEGEEDDDGYVKVSHRQRQVVPRPKSKPKAQPKARRSRMPVYEEEEEEEEYVPRRRRAKAEPKAKAKSKKAKAPSRGRPSRYDDPD
jgi:hypothetical protein